MKHLIIIPTILFVATCCAHQDCNNTSQRPPLTVAAATLTDPSPTSNENAATSKSNSQIPADAIQVSKPTGELQCGEGKGTSLSDIKALLASKKITVYDAQTQSDGMMHITLCGSPTGTIHVVSIPKKQLKQAMKLGFKPVR